MRILTPSLIVATLFVIGGVVFKLSTPMHCDAMRDDDSIFVLTGDARRIPFAMNIMDSHPDTDVYVIGVGAQLSPDMARRVTVEDKSKSTYQNARAIREIALQRGLDRIVVVTTEDHMTRANRLISSELPDTEIIACPVRLVEMAPTKRLERWTVEYLKYIATLIGIKENFYQ